MEALSARDPQRIGNYWLAGRLGSGGQGVVYDADGNRVAVKVLHAAGDRAVRDRFAKKPTAARRMSSFWTARVLAADLDGRRPYLVSEYVPGRGRAGRAPVRRRRPVPAGHGGGHRADRDPRRRGSCTAT
ncbi:hypothetical protein ACIBI9_18450 [Nonomuraea sp. NPDC050451]|uniref:hypothetical protein n=1 Tax=Nonomuraea sp. NPDC050451 TaxID=3364364 RepID=UPI003792B3CC